MGTRISRSIRKIVRTAARSAGPAVAVLAVAVSPLVADCTAADWEGVRETTRIASFRAEAVYLGDGAAPAGARFLHEPSGMPVDLLRFDSVPQAMIWIRTLPDSDRGEPHTAEHLVLGKGRKGRMLNLALDMSMGSSSAFTARCQTVYHFHTAGGRQSFLDLLYRQLDALLHPDFTDEEIRREVAHLVVVPEEDGGLGLGEQGTIYVEMLSAFEKPGTLVWSEVRRWLYGPGHPLGLESGGQPSAIRTMEPHHLRTFLARCYRPGPGFGLILAVPPQFELEPLLGDLDGLLRKVCNGALGEPPAGIDPLLTVPPASPPDEPILVLLPFPSASSAEPSAAVLAWAPYADLSPAELFRLRLLWYLVAGDETSLVHKDLVDQESRRVGPGIGSVGGWVLGDPGHPPMVWLGGLEPSMQGEEALARVRAVVAERLAWLAALPPDAPELATLTARARAYLARDRRSLIQRTDTPPRFGYRGTGDFWLAHLHEVNRTPGFHKDLLLGAHHEAIEAEMDRAGFWPDLVRQFDLGLPRLLVAAWPDTTLANREREEKSRRLAEALAGLEARHGVRDPQEALRRERAAFEHATEELAATEEEIGPLGFLADPPLTLDDAIDTRTERLRFDSAADTSGAVPICLNRFQRTATVDLGLYFDLTRTAPEELPCLALLPAMLADVGYRDAGGGWISNDELQQRLQREVGGVEAGCSCFPCEGGSRVELAIYGTGLGGGEGRAALDWCVRLLESAARANPEALPRLRDVVAREIAELRQAPRRPEESWADNPAEAYRYQRDAIYLSAQSIFTRLHHLERIGWRLRSTPAIEEIGLLANGWNDLLERWDGRRESLRAELDALDADGSLPPVIRDLTGYLRAEVDGLPDQTLREDLLLLYGQALDDLMRSPASVLEDLARLMQDLLAAGPSRAHLTGSAETVEQLYPDLAAAVTAMVARARAAGDAPALDGPTLGVPARPGRSPLVAGVVSERLRGRLGDLVPEPGSRPPYVALLIGSSRNALFTHSVRLASYAPPRRTKLLDCLAARLYAGSGAHSFFMKTWGAGLAYSNGIGASLQRGLVSYYAERCTDGVATLRFVTDLAADTDATLRDPALLDYALAHCFGEYRGGDTHVRRGRAMAADLADGITPEQVRRFQEGLLALREEWTHDGAEALLAELRGRLPDVIGPLLPGYGKPAAETWGSVNLMIGPEEQVDAYEAWLSTRDPGARLVRLHARDFWIDQVVVR